MNNLTDNIYYGTVLHQQNDPKRGGACSLPLVANKERFCTDVTFPVFSTTIFVWNKNTPESSGDGIEFYSEPFGWNSGARAGKNFLAKSTINNFWKDWSQSLVFDYNNVDQPEEYKTRFTNFQQQPGSIRVKGSYLVGLYSQSWYCQIFLADVPNLNEMEFVAQKNSVDIVNILPVK